MKLKWDRGVQKGEKKSVMIIKDFITWKLMSFLCKVILKKKLKKNRVDYQKMWKMTRDSIKSVQIIQINTESRYLIAIVVL